MITQNELNKLYIDKGMSMKEIATSLSCSVHKVAYWMDKHKISRRTISDAIYTKNNPLGNPFNIKQPSSIEDAKLLGMGIGLYWGEGTKANKHSVRLGNTDPKLLLTFIEFLIKICEVDESKLKFGLQIFTDIDPEVALNFWVDQLKVDASKFYKTTTTISGSIGTYKNKNRYGVVTIYFNNKKLRDILVGMLPR